MTAPCSLPDRPPRAYKYKFTKPEDANKHGSPQTPRGGKRNGVSGEEPRSPRWFASTYGTGIDMYAFASSSSAGAKKLKPTNKPIRYGDTSHDEPEEVRVGINAYKLDPPTHYSPGTGLRKDDENKLKSKCLSPRDVPASPGPRGNRYTRLSYEVRLPLLPQYPPLLSSFQ